MRLIPLLFLSFFLLKSAFAQNAEIPFSGGRPQVEYKQTGNTYQWKPVTGKMPSQGVVFGSGHGVSNAEPKINTQGKLPYSTKPGASTGPLKVSSKISPQKFGKVAGDILKGAITGAAGGGKIGAAASIAGVACSYYCQDLKDLLSPSDITHYRLNEDGSVDLLAKSSDNTDFPTSDGYYWRASVSAISSINHLTYVQAAQAIADYYKLTLKSCSKSSAISYYCNFADSKYTYNHAVYRVDNSSSCPAGHKVDLSTGKCFEPSDGRYTVRSWQELDQLFGGYAANINLWNGSRAPHLAANLAPKYDILDDTQPAQVTGPASAPISEIKRTQTVKLHPGSNIPVSKDHSGPSDSGTITTTETTTGQNTYSGDTMTTITTTTTTTNITNNSTNITTNNTSTSTTDEPPKEDDDAEDTELDDIPELYKKEYEDGIKGVWDDAIFDLKKSELFSLVRALTPSISDGGTCPSWNLDLSWTPGGSMGSYEIGSQFCYIWPILRVIILVTALFTARRLIFGG